MDSGRANGRTCCRSCRFRRVGAGLQKMIWQGAYVGTVVPPPATSLLNAPQYLTGKVLGDAAADYIRLKLDGKANVVLLTHDSLQFLAPRFTAMRDALRDIPGVDDRGRHFPADGEQGRRRAMMRTILLANPEVDVVLGADTVVLGALKHCARPARRGPISFSAASTAKPKRSPKSRRAVLTRPASAWHRRCSATPWASMPPTGSRARAFRRRWIFFRTR